MAISQTNQYKTVTREKSNSVTTNTSPTFAMNDLSIGMDLHSEVGVTSTVSVALDLQNTVGINGSIYSAQAAKNVIDSVIGANLQTTTTATTMETTVTNHYSREGKLITHEPTISTTDIGDRVIGMTDAQFMRPISILGRASNLKPKTKVYPFFDDKAVFNCCQPLPMFYVSQPLLPAKFSPTGQDEYGPYFYCQPYQEEWLFPHEELAGTRLSLDEILKNPLYTNSDFCQCVFVSYVEETEREEKEFTDKFGNTTIKEVIKRDPVTGKEIKVFKTAQLIVANWKGSKPGVVSENNLLREGMKLYGVSTGCECTILENPGAPGLGSDLITSETGQLGFIFTIPANTFRAGERVMVITDQLNNSYSSQSRASATFKSMGYNMISEGTVLSTRSVQFDSKVITDSKSELAYADRYITYDQDQQISLSNDMTSVLQMRSSMDNSIGVTNSLSGALDVVHTGDVTNSISGKIHAGIQEVGRRGGEVSTITHNDGYRDTQTYMVGSTISGGISADIRASNVNNNNNTNNNNLRQQQSQQQQQGQTGRQNIQQTSQPQTPSITYKKHLVGDSRYNDPLCQSFLVSIEGGIFVTAISVCFYNKDDSLPIRYYIVEMENGIPTSNIVPFSEVQLYPNDIVCVTDPEHEPWVWTRVPFEAPVYLSFNVEYGIILRSDSFYYDVWCATIGQKDLRTGSMITNQPYDGVLFKSQNSTTWTEDQETDLSFILERASFDISSPGMFIATNDKKTLEIGLHNSLETFIGSRFVRIHHPNHGLAVGNYIRIANLEPATTYNGIYGDQINGTKAVIQVEMDSFLIEASNSSDNGEDGKGTVATVNGRCAEAFPIYETNIPFDVFEPNVTHIIFPSTDINWSYKYTQGCSVGALDNEREIFGLRSTSFLDMRISETNKLESHGVIVTESNLEEPFDKTKNWSLMFKGLMASAVENLSPVIDTTRCGSILVNHRVDYPRLTQSYPTLTFTKDSNQVEVYFREGHIMQDGAMIYLDLSEAEGDLVNEMIYDELTGNILASEIKENENASLLPVRDPNKVQENNTAGYTGVAGRKTENNMYARDLEKWYTITRIDDNSVYVTLPDIATDNVVFDLANAANSSPSAKNYNLTGASVFYSKTHYKYVPETKNENNATSSRYFTKMVSLDRPSTSVRIMFAACCYGAADFEVWVKTRNEYDTEPFSNIEWWRITDESFFRKPSTTDSDFKDYECTLDFTTMDGNEELESFNCIACKLVMKSANQVQIPKFKDLRIICLGT